MTLFCCLNTWMTWAGRNKIINTQSLRIKILNNSLMIESRVSTSSGERFGTTSPGMHDLRSVASLKTNSASLTLYRAGLSQKIFKMSSLRTRTRLPLHNAIRSFDELVLLTLVAIVTGFRLRHSMRYLTPGRNSRNFTLVHNFKRDLLVRWLKLWHEHYNFKIFIFTLKC